MSIHEIIADIIPKYEHPATHMKLWCIDILLKISSVEKITFSRVSFDLDTSFSSEEEAWCFLQLWAQRHFPEAKLTRDHIPEDLIKKSHEP